MQEFIDQCDAVRALHREFTEHLLDIVNIVTRSNTSMPDLVDYGFLCKDTAAILDDWRKECNARVDLITKILALRSPGYDSPLIHGELASVTLDATIEVELPKSGTPEYDEVLKYFGVPLDVPFAPHWKHVQELVAERFREGVPLPPGFGKQYTKTRAIFRRKDNGENRQAD